jgi:hypothetical protein
MLIFILIIPLVLSGCASVSPKNPSFDRTWVYLEEAEKKSSGPVADSIKKAKEHLAVAELACADNTKLVDQYAKEISVLQGKADYWKQKQRKALKELWIWRGAFLAILLFAARGPILWGLRKLVGIPW